MTNLVEFPAGGALRQRVAEEVRALMARRRLVQVDLVPVLRVEQPQVSARLRGKVPFTLDDLEALAGFFQVPLSQLLGESGHDGGRPPTGRAVTGRYPLSIAA